MYDKKNKKLPYHIYVLLVIGILSIALQRRIEFFKSFNDDLLGGDASQYFQISNEIANLNFNNILKHSRPFFYIVEASFIKIGIKNPRIISLILSLLLVLISLKVGKEIFGEIYSFIIGLGVATSHPLAWHSARALREDLSLGLSLLYLYFLFKNEKNFIKIFIIHLLGFLLALTKLQYALPISLLFIYFLLIHKPKLKNTLLHLIMFCAFFSLISFYNIKYRGINNIKVYTKTTYNYLPSTANCEKGHE